MCKECYLKMLPDNGVPFEHKANNYKFEGDAVIVYASNTGNEFYFDTEDYERIKHICWYESNGYLRGYDTGTKKRLDFHRVILNAPDDKIVDHINRNTKDCRKSNLRICTQADNTKNKGLYKNNKSGKAGVFYDKKRKRWVSIIHKDHKRITLGGFENKDDAIAARVLAEKKYFGEFAPLA